MGSEMCIRDSRRTLQEEYNARHGITPQSIRKEIQSGIESVSEAHREANAAVGRHEESEIETEDLIQELQTEMLAAAESLEFERAASLRDQITQLREPADRKGGDRRSAASPRRKGRRRRVAKGSRIPRPKKR